MKRMIKIGMIIIFLLIAFGVIININLFVNGISAKFNLKTKRLTDEECEILVRDVLRIEDEINIEFKELSYDRYWLGETTLYMHVTTDQKIDEFKESISDTKLNRQSIKLINKEDNLYEYEIEFLIMSINQDEFKMVAEIIDRYDKPYIFF